MKELKVKLTFTEPILGTSPANPEIYREFIGSKSPDAATVEEEVSALGADAVAEKAMTVFPRMENGTPFLSKAFSRIPAAGSARSREPRPRRSRLTRRRSTS